MEVALVAIGGLIGVAAGWISAWVTGRFNLAAAKVVAQTETDRLAAQNERADREHRQGVYHEFVTAISRLDVLATTASVESVSSLGFGSPVEAKAFLEVMVVARDRLNGILLFGTEPVRAAAEEVDRLFAHAEGLLQSVAILRADEPSSFEQLVYEWDDHSRKPQWKTAMNDLRQAMRAEVAPAALSQ